MLQISPYVGSFPIQLLYQQSKENMKEKKSKYERVGMVKKIQIPIIK